MSTRYYEDKSWELPEREFVSNDVIELLLFALGSLVVFQAIWAGLVIFIIYKVSGKSRREVRHEIKDTLRQERREFERLRQHYADKIKRLDDPQKRKRVLERFGRDLEERISNVLDTVYHKHDLGEFQNVDKKDIKRYVRHYFDRLATYKKEKLRRQALNKRYNKTKRTKDVSSSLYIDQSHKLHISDETIEANIHKKHG